MIAKQCLEQHWEHNRLNENGFTPRLHAPTDTLPALFATFGDLLKQVHLDARCVLDSFVVAGCHKMHQGHWGRMFRAVSC